MKMLIVLSLVSTHAADVIDLGTISPARGILLEHHCPDFKEFNLELIALPSSNILLMTLTNSLLTVSNLNTLPSGQVAGGLTVITQNGEVSETKRFKFWLRRARPQTPEVRVIELGNPTIRREHFNWLNQTSVISYPSIPGDTNETTLPLPDAKSETYPEFMDRQSNSQLRRNQ